MRQEAGRPLSDAEVKKLYDEHLDLVERVQEEQVALLRLLVREHGVRRVLIEGLTPSGMDNYKEMVTSLGEIEQDRARLGEKRTDELRQRLLEFGAVGRLVMEGEVEAVPLEDDETLDAANPVRGGKVQFDAKKVEARHEAMVKRAVEQGEVVVILLGEAHDLSWAVGRLAPRAEYVRVGTSRLPAERCRVAATPAGTDMPALRWRER